MQLYAPNEYDFIGKRPFFLFLFFLFSEDEDAELIVKKHIALLHLYNETKDATQVRVESFILSTDRRTDGFFELERRY